MMHRLRTTLASLALASLLTASLAQAAEPVRVRPAQLIWDLSGQALFARISFRSIVTGSTVQKLQRGLPTTMAFTVGVFVPGETTPRASTVHSCRVLWHVWQEVYYVQVSRPGEVSDYRTATLAGVLRRCAEIRSHEVRQLLMVANRQQVPFGSPLQLRGRMLVNPLNEELKRQLQLWVSRPASTLSVGPGDALFSTFTGMFLQRVGEAEEVLDFASDLLIPTRADSPYVDGDQWPQRGRR